jgi:formate dehydrogenase maturation protein FdhE
MAATCGTAYPQDATSLKSIMVKLEHELCAVNTGLLREDYRAIAQAAEAIAHHPAAPREEMDRITRLLGTDAKRFEQADEPVHLAALSLQEAADKQQMEAVLKLTSELMAGCVACHRVFRERVRQSASAEPQR